MPPKRHDKEEYELAEAIPKFGGPLRALGKNSEEINLHDFRERPPTFSEVKEAGVSIARSFMEWNQELLNQQERFCRRALNGELTVTGVRVGEGIVPKGCELIPAVFFDGPKFDRGKSSLTNLGVHYEKVRVRQASLKDKERLLKSQETTKRGRPSRSEEIANAIKNLIKAGDDICNINRKVAIARVRDRLTQRTKIDEGMSNPVIQRELLRICGKRINRRK